MAASRPSPYGGDKDQATSNIGTFWPSADGTNATRTFCPIFNALVSALMMLVMTVTPSVREAAYGLLPWAVFTPIAGVACFQLDGIFIGATRTADMRNMMIVSLAVFLAAYAILTPAFGNQGLWASFLVFYAARAATLGLCYPALKRAAFGQIA